MKHLLSRIHTRVGDLWWYSAMIFIACRSGDVIQAFIGLWLVPKYVGPNELGAVLPLQQLSGLFAVPLAVIATVFAKYVNVYATRGEYGKVKSFIHDVLLASSVIFIICIAGAFLIAPFFYERLRIQSGLLTVLILAAGFSANVATLFTSALQGLKKFKTLSVVNIIGAPIRLITLLIGMPIRALSGYVLGQATPSASTALLAALSLRKDFKTILSDTGWRHDFRKILTYARPIAIYTILTTICGAICSTVYRQRLPELESGAYYILSRFSEMAMYIGVSLSTVLFPLAAEAHENGRENTSLLRKAIYASVASSFIFALFYSFFGRLIFSISPAWSIYISYTNLLPYMAIIAGTSGMIGATVTYDLACKRFSSIWITILCNILWVSIIAVATGIEALRNVLPNQWVDYVARLDIANIYTFTLISAAINTLQIVALLCCHIKFKNNRA